MAEINVQRKGPGPWLGIFGLVAAVLLVWAVIAMWNRGEDADMAAVDAPVTVPPAPLPDTAPTSGAVDAPSAEVAAFLTFTEAPVGSPVGPAHEYVADGIRRLSAALNAVIEEKRIAGTEVRDRLTAFRQKAERIQADPEAMGHAGGVRDVFTSATDLMSAARQERWADAAALETQISETRTAAGAIAPDRPLLDQTEAVKTFFDRAADVIRAMSQLT